MADQNQMQPIFIMAEGTKRSTGRDAQRNNILAAKLVAETVRTTLGPKGMDKMIVDSLGDVIITNDGVTILKEMKIEHPSAKMIVEIAKTQEAEVGDGTTTAVVLAGEFLKSAEELLDANIHPSVIVKGFQIAEAKAQEILNRVAEPIDTANKELLRKIAMTAMMGKGAEVSKERLADLTVGAVMQVMGTDGKLDLDNIKVEKRVGESSEASELIRGILLDKEVVHSSMPKLAVNAKILIYDDAIELKETATDAKIQINDPSQMQAFIEQEEKMLRNLVDKVIRTGCNVVFCQKGIDDLAQYFLGKQGILGARRVKTSDLDKLAKATGGKVVSSLDGVQPQDLGFAGKVYETKIGEDAMIYVEDCKNPKAVTILVRGGTDHVVEETRRGVEDVLGGLSSVLRVKKVVAGAGAPEMEVAKELRKYAESLSGREQLAVLAFAKSMEIIPKTLAENAGMDPIDVITELKANHEKGEKWSGVNVFTGRPMNAMAEGVIEPLKVKTQAIKSASEVAVMILRIDDVIMGGGSEKANMGNRMPPNMDGMM